MRRCTVCQRRCSIKQLDVIRNASHADFMFQLTKEEAMSIRSRSQSVTLKRGSNIKYLPYAFTEHGVLMLSSVLNSERAIQVNIEIMRAFVKLRQMLSSNAVLSRRLNERGSSPTVREGLVNSKLSLTRFEISCRYRSLPTNKSAFANGVRTPTRRGSGRLT